MSEWDHRELCPDGACVGVIGPDGTCKVCGRVAPNWGDERRRGLVDVAEDAEQASGLGHRASGLGPKASDSERSSEGDPDWDQRKLCPDGACLGVIGADGKCTVCGKEAA